jgi:hypothetical protein
VSELIVQTISYAVHISKEQVPLYAEMISVYQGEDAARDFLAAVEVADGAVAGA